MRKLLLMALVAILSFPAWSQSVRTNYRSEGMTHISTNYEPLKLGDVPSQLRVELVGFPDGSTLYLLYINLVQKEAVVVPKGVKMGVTLSNGKLIRLEQINQVSATPHRLEDGTILDRLKYAIEPADMEKMVRGIKSVDVVTGWNPDDYVQARFSEDQMGDLLKRHCETILNASAKTIDLQSKLSGYSENANSIMSTADPIVARGSHFDYNILLSHLYYKNTNAEDMDLAFVIGTQEQFFIPYDSPVRFTLADGSVISLLQAREDTNFVYLYPSMEDLARMCEVGIIGLTIDYKGGTLEDSFPGGEEKNGFSDAINQQVQLLLSLSPR